MYEDWMIIIGFGGNFVRLRYNITRTLPVRVSPKRDGMWRARCKRANLIKMIAVETVNARISKAASMFDEYTPLGHHSAVRERYFTGQRTGGR